MDCEVCGRQIGLAVEGATAYWCRDCGKLYDIKKEKETTTERTRMGSTKLVDPSEPDLGVEIEEPKEAAV